MLGLGDGEVLGPRSAASSLLPAAFAEHFLALLLAVFEVKEFPDTQKASDCQSLLLGSDQQMSLSSEGRANSSEEEEDVEEMWSSVVPWASSWALRKAPIR